MAHRSRCQSDGDDQVATFVLPTCHARLTRELSFNVPQYSASEITMTSPIRATTQIRQASPNGPIWRRRSATESRTVRRPGNSLARRRNRTFSRTSITRTPSRYWGRSSIKPRWNNNTYRETLYFRKARSLSVQLGTHGCCATERDTSFNVTAKKKKQTHVRNILSLNTFIVRTWSVWRYSTSRSMWCCVWSRIL